jgi:hypothetical protein
MTKFNLSELTTLVTITATSKFSVTSWLTGVLLGVASLSFRAITEVEAFDTLTTALLAVLIGRTSVYRRFADLVFRTS